MGKRRTRFYRRNEEEVMKRLGFRPTKNSGAGWVEKEDGENDYALCQLKSTDAQSISIKQCDLRTLENHACISHKVPVFALQFLNTGETWLMINEDEYKQYIEFKEQKELEKHLSPLLEEKYKETVDKQNKKSYNNNSVEKAKHNSDARKKYMEQMQMERDMFQNKVKEERKERTNIARKTIKTKRYCNI